MASTEQLLPREAQAWQDLAERTQAALQAGEYDEAGVLFLKLRDVSFGWLLAIARYKGPTDQADELVARAYVGLLELLQTDTPIRNVKALLSTILRRRIADAFRRGGATPAASADDTFWERHTDVVPDDADTVEEAVERDAARDVANTILDALPPWAREILIARHLDELSVAETAGRLGLSEDQVKKRRRDAVALARRIAKERGLV